MAELHPYPFGALVRRMFREWRSRRSIYDLPARRFFLGDPRLDLSVRFHARRAASPYGPAAGPQTQLAQNILLAWLGGARVIELKTVQVRDDLQIPRPCIDMQTVGFNIEWSQELYLEQSLEEYVKAAMLIEILRASGELPVEPGFGDTLFDMSVGYDLAGIQSARVQAFIRGMLDAGPTIERLRAQIPAEHRRFRDLDFATRISDTLTLSTFHGCPPDEIEGIVKELMEAFGLHCVVKLNPTLLGAEAVRRLLHETLGYEALRVPDTAFARDTSWEQAVDLAGRLREAAAALGLGFGIKLTNTLIVENHRRFFPGSAREMYLSGPPLHVLAVHLLQRWRRAFGTRIPISFSAGITRHNFADAVALGLVPVTVCTDLLKPGGYGRARGYFDALRERMAAAGARTIAEFVQGAGGGGEAGAAEGDEPGAAGSGEAAAAASAAPATALDAAILRNTERYVARVAADPRYGAARNARVPRKIGRRLELFDCLTCDKCIPVCPNAANFALALPRVTIPIVHLRPPAAGGGAGAASATRGRGATAEAAAGGDWRQRRAGSLRLAERHQIANVADFCNDCGNCDVFCPEDGGPYVLKPRFFLSRESWRRWRRLDGFWLDLRAGGCRIDGRFDGQEYGLELEDGQARYRGPGFDVTFDVADPAGSIAGTASGEVDLTFFEIMRHLCRALADPAAINWINCLAGEPAAGR